MGKMLEDYVMEKYGEMVGACLDYVDDRADIVYIYCSYRKKSEIEYALYCNFFYKIDEKILDKADLNVVAKDGYSYDVSPQFQMEIILDITESMREIVSLYREHRREVPTEVKFVYNNLTGAADGDYEYNLNDAEPKQLFAQWMEEVRAKEEVPDDNVSKPSFISKLFGKKD